VTSHLENDDFMSGHRSAIRSGHALALNTMTGDVRASLDLIFGMDEDERIAVISALASDFATALSKFHGGSHKAIPYLQDRLRDLAERG
jgi:hypothetical protein